MKKLILILLIVLPNLASAQTTGQLFPFLSWTAATGTRATTTSFFSTNASTTNLWGTLIRGFGLSTCSGANFLQWSGGVFGCSTPSGSGDVSSGSTLTDNAVVRGDGGAKGVQTSGVIIDDSNNITGIVQLTVTSSSTLQNFTFVNATGTNATTTNLSVSGRASSTSLTVSGVKSALHLANAGGDVSAYGGASACAANNFVTTLSAVGGTTCGTSSISGVSLGSNLNALTNGVTLLGSSYNGSAAISDWDIDLANGNVWTTASTTFVNGLTIGFSTTTNATSTNFAVTGLTAGKLVSSNSVGGLISSSTIGNNQLANSSIVVTTASPLGGAGTISLGQTLALTCTGCLTSLAGAASSTLLGDTNTWTGGNVFGNASSTNFYTSGLASSTNLRANVATIGTLTVGSCTGCGSGTPGGTGTELQYKNGSNFGAIVTSAYTSTGEFLGIGTTTPKWLLQLASSTNSQLTLSDGIAADNHWSFRNAGGNLYLATSSPTTFATSTRPALSIISGGTTGLVGIGTTTQTAVLSIDYSSNSANANSVDILNNDPTGKSLVQVSNSSGDSLLFGIFGSSFPATSLQRKGIVGTGGTGTSFAVVTDGGVASGGTGSILFVTGGYDLSINERGRVDPAGRFGFGTTTPKWLLQLATSTGAQLTLSDPSTLSNNHWSFRNAGGILYLATSSPTTFATSTTAVFSINTNGFPAFSSLGGGTGCIQANSSGLLSNTGSACGTGGGGSSNSKWATSTNLVAIYPNGGTTIGVVIGEIATTTNTNFEVNGTSTASYFDATNANGTSSLAALTLGGGSPGDRVLSIQRKRANINTELSFKDQGNTTIATLGADGVTTNDFLVAGTGAIRFYTGSTIGTNGFPTNERFRLSTTAFASPTTGGASITTGNGVVGTPTYAFVGDLSTGFWRPAAGMTALSVNGAEAFRVTPGISFGIGSSTPFGLLDLASSTPFYGLSAPFFTISTSTASVNPFNVLLQVTATTSTLVGSITGGDNGVRFAVGTTTLRGFQPLDQLTVAGSVNQTDRRIGCDVFNNQVAQLSGDTASVCNELAFIVDAGAVADDTVVQGDVYLRIRTSSTALTAAGNSGAVMPTTAWLRVATNTPKMEATFRIGQAQNATSTRYDIGFTSYTGVSDNFETEPTNGCYLEASSTQANWQLVSRNGTVSQVSTGVASSTVFTGDGQWNKARIEADSFRCSVYIASGTGNYKYVSLTSNLPTAATLNASVSLGRFTTAGLTGELHLRTYRLNFKGVDNY